MKNNLDWDDLLTIGGISLGFIVLTSFVAKELGIASAICIVINLLLIWGMSALGV